MYELKKILERYLRVNLLGSGPRIVRKEIYRAEVSQRLRNTGLKNLATVCLAQISCCLLKVCLNYQVFLFPLYTFNQRFMWILQSFRNWFCGHLQASRHEDMLTEYRGADKFLARPTSRYILFDGKNISLDASLVIYIYINSNNIPPIIFINRIYETQNLLSL